MYVWNYAVCCQLDNSAARVIAKKLPRLTWLVVQYNNIGVFGLENVLDSLADLKQLSVGNRSATQEETPSATKA